MKKMGIVFTICLASIVIFLLGFKTSPNAQPNVYYEVYLEGELLGMIESDTELNKYIQKQGERIKKNVRDYQSKLELINTFSKLKGSQDKNGSNKDLAMSFVGNRELPSIDREAIKEYLDEQLYNLSDLEISQMREYVDKNEIYLSTNEVYSPNGTEIKKVYTYDSDIITVEDMYKKLVEGKTFTLPGYKFTIKSKNDNVQDIIIYTTDPEIFSQSIEKLITIFVDDETYERYKSDTQSDIKTTGSKIENIYIDENITYKAVNVSVTEKIYTNADDLTAYLLYGDKFKEQKITVKKGDSIESLAFDNQISIQEFLIFNTDYTSKDNLLVPDSEVVISTVDPKISVVVESYEIVDKQTNYSTVEQYDSSLSQGSVVVMSNGENGVERVSQNIKSVNGEIAYVDPVEKEVIKSPVSKVVKIGTKYIATVGSTSVWAWPTNSGYTITSEFAYRINPINGRRELHDALDIAGTGYGSPIYSANNGVVVDAGYTGINGNYVVINHNNGYYTYYGHMSRILVSKGQTVERGQQIGKVGSTGWATGPHVHFSVYKGYPMMRGSTPVNPWSLYR